MNNFIIWLCRNINKLIYFLFWFYFFFLVVYKMLNYENNVYLAYGFWFLLGLYLGAFILEKTSKYLKMMKYKNDETIIKKKER